MGLNGLEILELSPGVTIQDRGRSGFRRFGVTGGGAMDKFGLAEGQLLLHNDADDAALEMFAVGGVFRSEDRMTIATSGAEMEISVNGRAVRWRSTIELAREDLLEIGRATDGVFGYLHLPGGIDGPVVLGSRSTHEPSGLGWILGPGDRLRPNSARRPHQQQQLPTPKYFSGRTIRIMDGPQSHLFREQDRRAIVSTEFTVSSKRNRMGIGLDFEGGPIAAHAGLAIASDAIVPGDIQVSGDGHVTVLMADSQPMGGYPRIASVITADQHVLAQFPPGTVFRMERIEPKEAVEALAQLEDQLSSLAGEVEPVARDTASMTNLLSYSMISGVVKGDEEHED